MITDSYSVYMYIPMYNYNKYKKQLQKIEKKSRDGVPKRKQTSVVRMVTKVKGRPKCCTDSNKGQGSSFVTIRTTLGTIFMYTKKFVGVRWCVHVYNICTCSSRNVVHVIVVYIQCVHVYIE